MHERINSRHVRTFALVTIKPSLVALRYHANEMEREDTQRDKHTYSCVYRYRTVSVKELKGIGPGPLGFHGKLVKNSCAGNRAIRRLVMPVNEAFAGRKDKRPTEDLLGI